MKVAMTTIAVLIAILGIAAGAAKIAMVPEEVTFLSQFGFFVALIIAFGVVQVLGGLSLMLPRRFLGSVLAGAAFALSALLLLVGGDLAFAGMSLIPVGLAGLVGYQSRAGRAASALGANDA